MCVAVITKNWRERREECSRCSPQSEKHSTASCSYAFLRQHRHVRPLVQPTRGQQRAQTSLRSPNSPLAQAETVFLSTGIGCSIAGEGGDGAAPLFDFPKRKRVVESPPGLSNYAPCHKDAREGGGTAAPPLTSALHDGLSSYPCCLNPGNEPPYALFSRLGEPQN
jgi:hypothetical protein